MAKTILESLEGVPELLAKEYVEADVGGKKVFYLNIEGDLPPEVAAPLIRARDHEKNSRLDVEKKLKDTSGRVTALQDEIDGMRRGTLPKDDVTKLEKSWADKLAAKETELTGQITARDATIREFLIDNVAMQVAKEVSIPEGIDLILPHVKSRLTTEIRDGKFVTRVLDADGKTPSALSIEELQKDISKDKRFAAIIAASKASGGGASGAGGGSSAPPKVTVDPKLDPMKASPQQLTAWAAERQAARKAAAK